LTQRLLVSVTEDSIASLPGVVSALRRAGMTVEAVHDALGTVTGSADPAVAASLRDVPGVLDVEWERETGVPRGEQGK
jgi:hypothetical protein